MNQLLELPDGNCKLAISKMLRHVLMNYLKTNEKPETLRNEQQTKEVTELKNTPK